MKEEDIIPTVHLTLDQFKGNVSSFKQSVIKGDYSPVHGHFSRTLLWKVCLITDSLDIKTWESKLGATRVVWHELVVRSDLLVPWHKLAEDSPYHVEKLRSPVKRQGSFKPSSIKNNLARVSAEHDPLASNDSRSRSSTPPPSFTTSDVELLETIIVDMDRIFPGNNFFASPASAAHKRSIISILYVWAKCNPRIGYKQGFHEIVGLIYLNLYRESTEIQESTTGNDRKILAMYNRKFLAHDVFTIFTKFLVDGRVIGSFYESEATLWSLIDRFNILLMKVDQLIHYNLISKLKLESQLWIIRYFRLMLLRELGDLATTSLLWDRMIAASSLSVQLPDLLCFMVISLLIQVKTDLVVGDFSESLSLLLHYPIDKRVESPRQRYEFINNLFADAWQLYSQKSQDLHLYECGNKLNAKYNPDMKITMSSSPAPTSDQAHSKQDQMRFEKTRLEMRLKKKAQASVAKQTPK
ncbi:GTPase-activating protein Gyp6p [Diutina catenulata]